MKPEDKQLVFQDLCARLPYGVKAQVLGWDEEKGEVEVPLKIYSINTDGYVYFETNDYGVNYLPVEDVRPYLRPLSSMTEEEKRTLQSFYPMSFGNQYLDLDKEKIELYECNSTMEFYLDDSVQMVDFCKKNHLDCYGLIKKDLAIKVTEDNNPYKVEI